MLKSILAWASVFLIGSAQAAISLSSTRVIFDGQYNEATIEVRNLGDEDVLLQAWLDAGSEQETSPLPFAVSPPLSKAPGKARQPLRLLYQGAGMPDDRESVLWLNVQEIPQNPGGENVLQLAVRQRIKVFYRPAGLATDASKAPAQLEWLLQRFAGNTIQLNVHNPSSYHVSLAQVQLTADGYYSLMAGTTMLRPGERRTIPMTPLRDGLLATLSFTSITDFGGLEEYRTVLSYAEPQSGTYTADTQDR